MLSGVGYSNGFVVWPITFLLRGMWGRPAVGGFVTPHTFLYSALFPALSSVFGCGVYDEPILGSALALALGLDSRVRRWGLCFGSGFRCRLWFAARA